MNHRDRPQSLNIDLLSFSLWFLWFSILSPLDDEAIGRFSPSTEDPAIINRLPVSTNSFKFLNCNSWKLATISCTIEACRLQLLNYVTAAVTGAARTLSCCSLNYVASVIMMEISEIAS